MNARKPDLTYANRLIASTRNELKPVQELKIVGKKDENNLIDALPYYLLAYGGNLEYLATFVNQPILRLVITGAAKGLTAVAKYYKINVKELKF